MIVKPFEAERASGQIASLMRAYGHKAARLRACLNRSLESDEGASEAARFIDLHYSHRPGTMVIHGFRFEVEGEEVFIDHLLVSRLLRFVVVDSRSFSHGMRVNASGEFSRRTRDGAYEGALSPLFANQRKVEALHMFLRMGGFIPTRLGFPLKPSFEAYVLVSSKGTIDRPGPGTFPSVCRADFFADVYQSATSDDALDILNTIGSLIGAERLERIARAMAGGSLLDRSTPQERYRDIVGEEVPWGLDAEEGVPSRPAPVGLPSEATFVSTKALGAFRCRRCDGSDAEIRFGYSFHFHCNGCHAKAAIRLPVAGTLRRDGNRFYVDEEGRPPKLFFVNPEAAVRAPRAGGAAGQRG